MTKQRLAAPATLAAAVWLAGCGGSSPSHPASTTSRPAATSGTNQRPDRLITVYVARSQVPRCRSVDELLVANTIVLAAVPAGLVPADAITNLRQLAGRWTTHGVDTSGVITTADVAQPPIVGC